MVNTKKAMFNYVTAKKLMEKTREELLAKYNELIFEKEEEAEKVDKELIDIAHDIKRIQESIWRIKEITPESTLKEWGREYQEIHQKKK